MNHIYQRCKAISGKRLAFLALSSAITLSACSGGNDGTVTTLEESRISLNSEPDFLFTGEYEGVFNRENLRPIVTLSNGENVTMVQVDGKWSGDIFVAPASDYTVTVTWLERSDSRPDLNITRRTFDVIVANDGSATENSRSDFVTAGDGLDFDNDGISNVQERVDPIADPFDPTSVPGVDIENENGTEDCPVSNTSTGIQGEWTTSHPEVSIRSRSLGDGVEELAVADLAIKVIRPAVLFNDAQFEGVFDQNNLRPVITFKNGDVVTATIDCEMRSDDLETWEGAFSIEAGEVYNVTITWIEIYDSDNSIDNDDSFDGRELPLVIRTFDSDVGNDGQATTREVGPNLIEITDNDADKRQLNADEDEFSNATERSRGSSPFLKPGEFQQASVVEFQATATKFHSATADVIVPRIGSIDVPSIDGENVTLDNSGQFTGEWAKAVQTDISGAMLNIDNRVIDMDAQFSEAAPLRRWAAMHDGEDLYIALAVEAVNENDVLELLLGLEVSTSLLLPLNELNNDAQTGLPEPLDLDFASGQSHLSSDFRSVDSGYQVYELRLSLSATEITIDDAFGFGLQINDDSSGNDPKWGWKPPANLLIDIGTLKLE